MYDIKNSRNNKNGIEFILNVTIYSFSKLLSLIFKQ